MLTFHNYISFTFGLFLIACSISFILFPPKFGNTFYGIRTKWTMKNKAVWDNGHRLFAVPVFFMGVIFSFLGGLKIDDNIPGFAMFGIILILWALSKFIVHKLLAKKYFA